MTAIKSAAGLVFSRSVIGHLRPVEGEISMFGMRFALRERTADFVPFGSAWGVNNRLQGQATTRAKTKSRSSAYGEG